MSRPPRNHVSDLRGVGRLAIDATAGLTGLVEAMHANVASGPTRFGRPIVGPAADGVAALVYGSIRGVTRVVGGGIDVALGALAPALGHVDASPAREAIVAALNGVLGDYLADTGSPLGLAMGFRRDGRPLELTREALAAAIPAPSGRLLVLAHGLCMNDLQWNRHGHDHGASLAQDLGYTPVYLHYNTGLHVSTNGRAFAERLEALAAAWPVPLEEVVIVGHSMGGLVARSAHHHGTLAGHAWPRSVRGLVFLGTPHHGAPLERGGHWIDVLLEATPYTAPLARLGRVRSAGITDLRHGCLLDEDWKGRDRFTTRAHSRRPVPLPEGVRCYAVGATIGSDDSGLGARVIGDGLVPLQSALGQHRDPRFALAFSDSHRWIARRTAHLDLLSRGEVYERLRAWLAD